MCVFYTFNVGVEEERVLEEERRPSSPQEITLLSQETGGICSRNPLQRVCLYKDDQNVLTPL